MTETAEVQDVKKSKNKLVSPSDPLSPVGIRLGEDLRAAVELEAEQRGISLGEVCRELIQDGMNDSPKRQHSELLRCLGVAKQHLTRFIESEKAQGKSWFRGGHRAKAYAEDVIEGIDSLQGELKEPE